MSRYVASLDTEWEFFTEQHKKIWHGSEDVIGLESVLRGFITGSKPNPIAIRGAIGQGKTQLLYKIFKFVWENGGISFYTTLDMLIPETETTATDFAQQIDTKIKQCVESFKSGEIKQIPFLTDEMRKFVENCGERDVDRIVFLIDEMERSYAKILSKVKTDDRSPFGYWLEHTPHLPIAAFAPISHYEALYGEAEKRRWDSISIPPMTATTLRSKDKDLSNFVWWVSRGRLGISYKVSDSVKRKKFSRYKDFEDLQAEIGAIAGVPAIDLDIVAKLSSSFHFVTGLFPQGLENVPSVIEGEIVNQTEFLNLLKDALKAEGWRERSVEFLTYYLGIITDSVSRNGNILLPLQRHDEILSLIKLGVDLAIEHETLEKDDTKYISDHFRGLEDTFAAFFYTRLYPRLQLLSKGKGAVLSYQEITKLFPMPITSPIFGGFENIDKAKEVILSSASYDYVAANHIEATKGLVTFLFFPSEAKLSSYLNSHELVDFLPTSQGLICVLLDGDPLQVNIQGTADWLRQVRRLKIEVPNKMLASFLLYFIAWVYNEKIAEGCIDELDDVLTKQAEQLWSGDRESSRKVDHYGTMLETFESSLKDLLEIDREKFAARASQDSIRRYGGRYKRFSDIVGLAFTRSKDEHNLIYRFRKLLLDSPELKSMKSGIGGLLEDASFTRTGLSLALENIRKDYEKELPVLLALASQNDIQEDYYTSISYQNEAKSILRGMYTFARNDASPSQLSELKKEIEEVLQQLENLGNIRKDATQSIGISIRDTKSERNENQIKELQKIIDEVANSSHYPRWLLFEFATAIIQDFKDEYLHPDQSTSSKWETRCDTAKNCALRKQDIDKVNSETFDWLDMSKEQVNDELNNGYKEALEALIRYSRELEWDNVESLEWSPFEDKVDELIGMIDKLKDIDSTLKDIVEIAQSVDVRLGEV